jgi:2-keto-3-deoxy-L-rhamnonate aldolase RhmA
MERNAPPGGSASRVDTCGAGQAETAASVQSDGSPGRRGRQHVEDPFHDGTGAERVVRGVCIYSGSTRLAELAARIGYEAVWIEMEHGPADFADIEAMCVSVETGGGLPTVRVPDGHRHHVLRALEVGARIVVVPLVNTADEAQRIVEYGKFAPLGSRGFNLRSRGVGYGLKSPVEAFAYANARTFLFAQVETMRAVENLDAICAVEGLAGVFVGPGDLSVSFGAPAALADEGMITLVADCVRRARAAGKHAGILVTPGGMLDAALDAGANLVFVGGDYTELTAAWPRLLASVPHTVRAVVAKS